MEKKKISKLCLNKKTLRNLDDNKLAEVHGGQTVGCTNFTRACSLCTQQCSVCCQ